LITASAAVTKEIERVEGMAEELKQAVAPSAASQAGGHSGSSGHSAPRREGGPGGGHGGPRRDGPGGPGGPGGGPGGPRRGKRQYFRKKKVCKFCVEKMDLIDYKRADILSQFVQERGKILPRRMTGVCSRHQRWLGVAIKRARNIALLPFAGSASGTQQPRQVVAGGDAHKAVETAKPVEAVKLVEPVKPLEAPAPVETVKAEG
jgi:small subunit ribosomal protein S18